MLRLTSIGELLVRGLLLPGDLACDRLGLGQANNRELIRMLVNSLVWTFFAAIAVAITLSQAPR